MLIYEVIVRLVEIKLYAPSGDILESVNQILINIKKRMKTRNEYFFLYKHLSDILSYKIN